MFQRDHLKLWSAALALIACVAAGPSASVAADAVATVDVSKFSFGPKEITIAPGTRVRWINHDEVPHTVASPQGQEVIGSKALDTDDQYEVAFQKEGDYAYFCTVHPFMTGVVHVHKQ